MLPLAFVFLRFEYSGAAIPRSSREAQGASAAKEAAGDTLDVEEEETQGLTPLHWAQVQIYHISLDKSSLGGRYIGICQARLISAAICVLTVTNRTRGVNANLGPLRLRPTYNPILRGA